MAYSSCQCWKFLKSNQIRTVELWHRGIDSSLLILILKHVDCAFLSLFFIYKKQIKLERHVFSLTKHQKIKTVQSFKVSKFEFVLTTPLYCIVFTIFNESKADLYI